MPDWVAVLAVPQRLSPAVYLRKQFVDRIVLERQRRVNVRVYRGQPWVQVWRHIVGAFLGEGAAFGVAPLAPVVAHILGHDLDGRNARRCALASEFLPVTRALVGATFLAPSTRARSATSSAHIEKF